MFRQGLLNRTQDFENQIHRLNMDLEDQTKSRMMYQQEARAFKEEKRRIEHMIVLILRFPWSCCNSISSMQQPR